VTSFIGIGVRRSYAVFALFAKTTRRIRVKLFSELTRKDLVITTYIKKHCTRPSIWGLFHI